MATFNLSYDATKSVVLLGDDLIIWFSGVGPSESDIETFLDSHLGSSVPVEATIAGSSLDVVIDDGDLPTPGWTLTNLLSTTVYSNSATQATIDYDDYTDTLIIKAITMQQYYNAVVGSSQTVYDALVASIGDDQLGGGNPGIESVDHVNDSGAHEYCDSGGEVVYDSTPYSGGGTYTLTFTSDFLAEDLAPVTAYLAEPNVSITNVNASYVFDVNDSVNINANEASSIAVTWSITPALPAGLSLDTSTGVISGTPSGTSVETTYTITATSNAEPANTDDYDFTIEILVIDPDLSGNPATFDFTKDAAGAFTPTNTGATATSWSLYTGTLPDGLTLNTSTGVISGTPTTAGAYAITLRATAATASDVDNHAMTLNVIVPPVIAGVEDSYIFIYDESSALTDTVNITPSETAGGPTTTWSLGEALPSGLSFSTTTGAITGTPSEGLDLSDYTLTATNSDGFDEIEFTIEIRVVSNATTNSGSGTVVDLPNGINGRLTYWGSSDDIISGAWTKVDKQGLLTGGATIKVPPDRISELAPRRGDPHPYDPRLICDEMTVTYSAFASCKATYAGIDLSYDDEETDTDPVYTLTIGTQEEPIETHKDFISRIAGKPSDAQNGAIFIDGTGEQTEDDSVGFFDRFSIDSDLRGQESYVSPSNIVFNEKYTSKSRPNTLTGVGKIQNPPSQAPNIGDGFNWLYLGITYEERGNVFSITRSWRLSGKGGWNKLVYT